MDVSFSDRDNLDAMCCCEFLVVFLVVDLPEEHRCVPSSEEGESRCASAQGCAERNCFCFERCVFRRLRGFHDAIREPARITFAFGVHERSDEILHFFSQCRAQC